MPEEKQTAGEKEIAKQLAESAAGQRAEELRPHINGVVEYYDGGARIGYLLTINRTTCDVQPIGSLKAGRPRNINVPIASVWVCTGPTKYPTLESYASFAGWEKQVFIPVNQTESGRYDSSVPQKSNTPKPEITVKVDRPAPGAPRQAREEIVNSAEFIALFEQVRARFKDPGKTTCKRGHPLCAQNAHVGDLRRPPHRYSCDPCLRKIPAAPGFSE